MIAILDGRAPSAAQHYTHGAARESSRESGVAATFGDRLPGSRGVGCGNPPALRLPPLSRSHSLSLLARSRSLAPSVSLLPSIALSPRKAVAAAAAAGTAAGTAAAPNDTTRHEDTTRRVRHTTARVVTLTTTCQAATKQDSP